MSTFRNIAVTLAALSVLAFFGICAWIAIDVNAKVLVPFEVALKGKHTNGDDGYVVLLQRFLQNTTAAANAVKQVAQDTNRIAKAQEGPSLALTQSSVKLLDAGTQTISKLNGSVDGLNDVIADVKTQTLPRVNTGVDTLNDLVGDLRPTAQALTVIVNESTNVVKSLNLAVNHADILIADPAFHQIAGNLNSMSVNLTNASANINSATSHADKALGYVELDLSPKHEPFWRGLLSEALSQAIGIPLKWMPTRVAVTSSVPVPAK